MDFVVLLGIAGIVLAFIGFALILEAILKRGA